ncbi:HAMP domain-containing histidine kinase [Kaistella anthropi]|nr:HAMP domain-containing histidine kinase [Kaistella anthropi]
MDDEEMPLEIKKDFLGNIISESDRLAEIINDILYLDKLEVGTTPLNIEHKNITETYHKALKPLHQLFDQKNLHHSEVNLLKNELFYFDEMKMIQLFQNILGNSLKFANEQGMVQTKLIKGRNVKNFNVQYRKKNPGRRSEFIFEKFYQSKNQNIRKPLGSGLGLAICKKIINAHGGTITAKNKEIGVTFEILLPIK